VELRETHISWVFLAGDRAYKLKKPLALPFLDYGTPARRRKMCREEVRLNRRLARGIDLGVRGVAPSGDDLELVDDTDPRASDYIVEMRRFDEARTMSAALARGELNPADVNAVARLLAGFHDRARPATIVGNAAEAVQREIDTNFAELPPLTEHREEREERELAVAISERVRRGQHGCARRPSRARTDPRMPRRPTGRARHPRRAAVGCGLRRVRSDAPDTRRRGRFCVSGYTATGIRT
jgi:aminoglycoside phosphotransferase family enzyme